MHTVIAAVFLLLVLSTRSAVECNNVSTHTGCYSTNGNQKRFNITCPSSSHILIHSADSQTVVSCNSQLNDTAWSTNDPELFHVWMSCNLQKGTCINGVPTKTTYFRIKYSCEKLTALGRFGMCVNISEKIATPFFLESEKYPNYTMFSNANCHCEIRVNPEHLGKLFKVTVHSLIASFEAGLTLRSDNSSGHQLQASNDSSGYHRTGPYTATFLSKLSATFFTNYDIAAYLWIEISGNGSLSVACHEGRPNSTAQPPTTAPPTPSTPTTSLSSSVTPSLSSVTPSSTSATISSSSITSSPSSETSSTSSVSPPPSSSSQRSNSKPPSTTDSSSTPSNSVTGIPPSTPQGVVGITDDGLKLIYIVVPTVLIALIILIVIIVIVKKRPHQHYTKTDDTIRFKPSDFSSDDIYSRENFAVEMVDNDIYQSQDSLSNGSLSGPVSSYGVGVAFGTFKGEKVPHRSNEDLTNKAEEDTHDNKDKYRGMIALPKSETFGGEDLFIGAEVGGHDDDDGVVYAQVHKPVKRSVVFDLPDEHGQAGSEHEEFTNNNQIGTDSSTDEIEEYSLADDFDDQNEYFEYDVGSRSNEAEDGDGDGDDYAIAYTRRRSSKRREPQQSLHIYDDVNEDDFAKLGSNNATASGEVDEPQPDNMDDEQDDGDYDTLDFRGEKHQKKIDKIVDIQRTEL